LSRELGFSNCFSACGFLENIIAEGGPSPEEINGNRIETLQL
jgi:hypothetical protein